jgi:DNA polymerase-1
VAPLLVVDAPSLLFRAFYALPDSIRDGEGHPVNALLGTANLLLFEIERHAPRAVVLCFGAEAAHYRKAAYPPYHADRIAEPDGLGWQWARARDFFERFGFFVADSQYLEADDLLGSYATAEVAGGGEALILTGDRDMFQCAGERVRVLYLKTGGPQGAEEMGPAEVVARYGVPPEAVPDFIALRGDPSDGLPGAKGIGEKTAADLLRRHGTARRRRPTCCAATGRWRRRWTRRSGRSPACARPCWPTPTCCARSRTSPRCATSTSSCRRTAGWTRRPGPRPRASWG